MSSILHDVRFACRSLARRPGFTIIALVTLTLGLGANVAIFSVVQGVVLRPLPYTDAERLVRLQPDSLFPSNLEEALYLDEHAPTLAGVAAWGRSLFLLETDDSPPEELRGAVVDPHHFLVLGAPPALGRGFESRDGLEGAEPVVVLGYELWQRRFGGEESVVGQQVQLSGRARTVVGILGPHHQRIEEDWQVWAPMVRDVASFGGRPLAINARLADGASLGLAQDEVRTLMARFWTERGREVSAAHVASVALVPLRTWLLGDADVRLMLLLAAVGLVLLIACLNVANLLLARGGSRRQELSVRAALGAERGRLVHLLVTESLVLGVVGGGLGLVLGAGLLRLGLPHLPADLPRTAEIGLDAGVFAFAALVSLLASALFGLLPAWRSSEGVSELRSRGFGGRSWLGSALVAGEVALALTVVVVAGLMTKSFLQLERVDPGFDAEGVIAVRPSPPSDRYDSPEKIVEYYRLVTDRVAAVPDVEQVGAIPFLPMTPGGAWAMYRTDDTRAIPADGDLPGTSMRVVTEDYFETMGVSRLAGRSFEPQDAAGLPVVVVNQTLAEAAWPRLGTLEEVVGRTLFLGRDEPTALEVVGVVGDVRQSRLDEPAFAEAYMPFSQNPWRRMYVAARLMEDVDPSSRAAAVRDAVLSVDRDVAVSAVVPVKELVGATSAGAAFLAALLSAFGMLALILGVVGVYGVTVQAVLGRRRETGIRMALGARRVDVLRGIIVRGLRPVAVGLVLGAVGALSAGRFVRGLLFEVVAADTAVLTASVVTLAVAAGMALVMPAYKASRTDPMVTLREE
ncbi:MAG: ADOP family duplicated permease [Thermoanaerobaculia bacterium]|nr:ADOP family duplicated permease [Thermoanaerobaculia bacterium]